MQSEEEKIPNFGGGLLGLGAGKVKTVSRQSTSSLASSSENNRNSKATLEFINRPSGAKSSRGDRS